MTISTTMEFRGEHLLPVIKELSKVTLNTGEGATACLAIFVMLWRLDHPDQPIEEVAEWGRRMILSYGETPSETPQ